ncbi:MAG: family 16 glycoside hydrolase [Planctomycetota bacterium]
MEKWFFICASCFLGLSMSPSGFAQQGQKVTVSEILGERKECYFDEDKPGELPANFQVALTGKGEPSRWIVKKIENAPSDDNVVVQTKLGAADYRFPLLIINGVSYKDFMVFTRFRSEGGSVEQSGGLVFKYKDNNNYYVLRASVLEGNVRLYKIVSGNQTQIGEKNLKVNFKEWHLLKVICKADKIQCFFNNKKVFEVSDETFDMGSVGLWTKSDAYTFFDDLVMQEMK